MNEFNIRRWVLPLVYGLATANFIAVIQLISADQVQPPSFAALKEGGAQLRGFFGMAAMCLSIPLLIGYAFYTEHVLEFGGAKFAYPPLGIVITAGVFGLAFTFSSFHPAFGIAFFVSFLVSGFLFRRGFAWMEKRSKPN